MKHKVIGSLSPLQYLLHIKQQTQLMIQQYWFGALFIGLGVWLVLRKDISLNLELNSWLTENTPSFTAAPVAQAAGLWSTYIEPEEQQPATDDRTANHYSNLTYTNAGFATKESAAERLTKRQRQNAYIEKYAQTAQAEMEKYGIPASIKLAQGLLESDAGYSRLARDNNNHFGIKCFSRTCKKGHCSNFTDDSHKDFFRKYGTAWESYRSHTLMLRSGRYKHLFKLDPADYRSWAKGLDKAGYATDKNYGAKLINLIEELDLHRYDR